MSMEHTSWNEGRALGHPSERVQPPEPFANRVSIRESLAHHLTGVFVVTCAWRCCSRAPGSMLRRAVLSFARMMGIRTRLVTTVLSLALGSVGTAQSPAPSPASKRMLDGKQWTTENANVAIEPRSARRELRVASQISSSNSIVCAGPAQANVFNWTTVDYRSAACGTSPNRKSLIGNDFIVRKLAREEVHRTSALSRVVMVSDTPSGVVVYIDASRRRFESQTASHLFRKAHSSLV
jgi:hypothetical protein